MKESTVYLLQDPSTEKDLSSAAKYGKIEIMVGAQDKPSVNVAAAMATIRQAINSYDSESDYLCHAGGDPLVLLLTGIELERKGISEITYLIWNRSRDKDGNRSGAGFYLPKKIQINNRKKATMEEFDELTV